MAANQFAGMSSKQPTAKIAKMVTILNSDNVSFLNIACLGCLLSGHIELNLCFLGKSRLLRIFLFPTKSPSGCLPANRSMK